MPKKAVPALFNPPNPAQVRVHPRQTRRLRARPAGGASLPRPPAGRFSTARPGEAKPDTAMPCWQARRGRTFRPGTCLRIPRVSRCESTAAPARRAAQHSTHCTGRRRNAAGVGVARNPLGRRRFSPPPPSAAKMPGLPFRAAMPVSSHRKSPGARPWGILRQVLEPVSEFRARRVASPRPRRQGAPRSTVLAVRAGGATPPAWAWLATPRGAGDFLPGRLPWPRCRHCLPVQPCPPAPTENRQARGRVEF